MGEKSGLKPMTIKVFFPSDMDVGSDRAKWYVEGAIRGWWQQFATENDPIRNMRKAVVAFPALSAARDEGRAEGLGGEWVMVPREPTREMLKAAGDYADECARLNYGGAPDAEGVWDAMITAAPPASQTQEG